MKYIKLYENIEGRDLLKPGYMYSTENSDICYIGYNHGSQFPYLCLIMQENSMRPQWIYSFIEWNRWGVKDCKPLNMTLKEYIIEKDIVLKTIKSFEKPTFSSGGCRQSLEKIENSFKYYLLNDVDLEIFLDANKYNL